ncbi:MAG: superoxide dismutase [Dehalococcoidales bacterium]|nr:superoxide dismutase [Dehalococcoidales bacterium]
MATEIYSLPALIYGYAELEPYISEDQLRIHHSKHHQAYVNGANALLEKIANARKNGTDLDIKAVAKELSFHLAGHRLHSLFWRNMMPNGKDGGGSPQGKIADLITQEFGTLDRFKKEFSQAANSTEGSGWAALIYDVDVKKINIIQIEKHNVNVVPDYPILMVLDVWEHAYYMDYKNERNKFVDAFWNIVFWGKLNERLADAIKLEKRF